MVAVTPEQANRRVVMVRQAFGAEALIGDFEDLVKQLRCHPRDRAFSPRLVDETWSDS